MRREVTGTGWVVLTLAIIVVVLCTAVCLLGLAAYEITGRAQ